MQIASTHVFRFGAALTALCFWLMLAVTPVLAQPSAQTQPQQQDATPRPRPKIGLVLSGGGARGLSHAEALPG